MPDSPLFLGVLLSCLLPLLSSLRGSPRIPESLGAPAGFCLEKPVSASHLPSPREQADLTESVPTALQPPKYFSLILSFSLQHNPLVSSPPHCRGKPEGPRNSLTLQTPFWCSGSQHRLRADCSALNPASLLTTHQPCDLGKLLHLSLPQFPQLENDDDNNNNDIYLVVRIKRVNRYEEWCLAHSKYSGSISYY